MAKTKSNLDEPQFFRCGPVTDKSIEKAAGDFKPMAIKPGTLLRHIVTEWLTKNGYKVD